MANTQKAVLLPSGSADPAAVTQVDIPSLNDDDDATLYGTYACLFSEGSKLELRDVPFTSGAGSDAYSDIGIYSSILLLSAYGPQSKEGPVNALASELVLAERRPGVPIYGDTYVLHQDGSDFLLKPHWEAVYDICYGSRFEHVGKKVTRTMTPSEQRHEDKKLAKQYSARLQQLSDNSTEVKMEQKDDQEDDAWTDEEVEKPREPKKHVDDSDDERMDGEEAAEEEDEDEGDEDSEGSYDNEESELESDEDDNDPRKKALLDMIKAAITKDGKLDLERLGLVEKNGKLVPKDD